MSRYRYRHRRISDINVVPYIDVMLVLLIIFMITSPLLSRNIEVQLPTVKKTQAIASKKLQLVIITVDAQGQIFLGKGKQTLSMKELLKNITALIRVAPNSQVLVRGDNRLAYGKVVKVMSYKDRIVQYSK